MKSICLLGILLLSAAAMNPQEAPTVINSGSDYLQNCKFVEDQTNSMYTVVNFVCLSWTAGFFQGAMAGDYYQRVDTHRSIFCGTTEVTTGQMIHVILKYIKDHAEEEHQSAGALAYLAMIQAFGCKSQP